MTFNELEIGKFYTCGDDATYKVVDKGNDWILTLDYSYNHHVATPWIFSINDDIDIIESWHEETDDYGIFDNLSFNNPDMLKEK